MSKIQISKNEIRPARIMKYNSDVLGWQPSSYRMTFICLILALLLIGASGDAKSDEEDDDEITFRDFSLYIGDRIELEDYQMELIEIQSIRDGLVVMRVSKVGGALDEQRALLLDSPNNFDGGADGGGITITIADIFDEQSARIRLEYEQKLGTPRKRTSDRPAAVPEKPDLWVDKSFDKSEMNVGDESKVTITIKNNGTGQAVGIEVQDIPPLPQFTYIAGYPPKIKETLDPGQSDSAIYMVNAAKEGTVSIPSVLISYADSKGNSMSNRSEPFSIVIRPRSRADLTINAEDNITLALEEEGRLNISILNSGSASATKIEVTGDVRPGEGLEAVGLDKSFFEIAPGDEAAFSASIHGQRPGDYAIRLKANYNDGEGLAIRESTARVTVLEREYKYQYLLVILPIAIVFFWIYRRHREYKY